MPLKVAMFKFQSDRKCKLPEQKSIVIKNGKALYK